MNLIKHIKENELCAVRNALEWELTPFWYGMRYINSYKSWSDYGEPRMLFGYGTNCASLSYWRTDSRYISEGRSNLISFEDVWERHEEEL